MRVVINQRYGGFGLSDEGVRRYAKIKGLKLYPEKTRYGFTVYRTVPEDERGGILEDDKFHEASIEDRQASNKRYGEITLYPKDIPRGDPALVQVVEEMGKAAFGNHATLSVIEIPDDVQWEIAEYDGFEHVAEKHRTWP